MRAFFRKNFFILLSVLVFSLFASFHIIFAQSTDLASQWDGDAVSGKTALDVKNGNNGTLSGGVSIVPGKVGNAFKFDGSGSINAGNPASLNFGTGPFSLEVWFNWDGSGGTAANNIIRKSNYPSRGPGSGYWLRMVGGQLEFSVGATTGPDGQSFITAPVSSGAWHHAVAVKDGSGGVKLYVDGRSVGTIHRQAENANSTSEDPFVIGAWRGSTEFFHGLIDEVSVYSRALDSSEVESLYDGVEDDIELYGAIEPYIKSGETPGQCTIVRECRAYCDLEENFDECFDFAVKAGLIEIEDPYLLALQNGEAPGGCIGEDACAEYCEEASHIKECVSFLEKFDVLPPDVLQKLHELIDACEQEPDFVACIESGAAGGTEEPADLGTDVKVGVDDSQTAQKMLDTIQKGESPGKCKDEASCRTYCENIDNIQECLVFVEEFDLATPDELKEMRQMAAAKGAGVPFPGNCKTRQSCLQYCEAPSHSVECVNFAEAAGYITEDDAAQAKKFAPLIASGETPGQCATKDECEAYCEQGAHIDECLDFAITHELFPPDEIEIMKKIQPFVKAGTMPGGCKSKTECEAYCTDGDHFEECLEIGLAIGVINPDEVDIIRKSGGKGPGNCRSKEACEAFCQQPANQKECTDFAVRIGLMTPEEAEQAQSAGDMGQCFEEADEKITACFVTNLGVDMFEQMKAGKMPYDLAILEKMRKAQACMRQYSDQATDILEDFLKAMPVANACIAGELGPDFVERLRKMTVPCSQMKGITGTMEACFQKGMSALFEPCAAKDCSEIQSCMMDVSKAFMGITGQVEGGDHPEFQEQELPPVLQEKLNSCGIDANFDPNICVSEPTCEEFFSCLNPSGSQTDAGSQEEPSGEMPAELKARMDSCKGELVESMKEEIQAKLNVCLVLSCPEFQACMQSLQQSGGEQQEQEEQTPDPAIQAKFESCFSQDQGGGPPPGDNGPPSGIPPSGGGDQSQIPEGYSSWQEFCMAQSGDSRCSSSMPQVDCSLFASVPSCSYVGSPDSQNYSYCKQCYPDR